MRRQDFFAAAAVVVDVDVVVVAVAVLAVAVVVVVAIVMAHEACARTIKNFFWLRRRRTASVDFLD